MKAKLLHSAWVCLGMMLMLQASCFAQTYVNFEGKQCRPICLSPDGTKLFAVNTPDARLSVFDITYPLTPFLIAEIPVGVEPVSVNALDNDTAWVVNEVSDSVSVVSVSRKIVTDTIYAKDEPSDVVFAGGKAFVSESRNNQIAVFDATNHTLLTNIVLFGRNPRSLAVNSAGTKVYAAFALSGNRTTIVPATQNPTNQSPISPPMNTNLPAPPQVGRIVDAADPAWTNVIRFTMPDNDVVELDVATMQTNRYFTRVGTVNFSVAINPATGDLFVANTDAGNLTRFEPNVRGSFDTNRIARINITTGAVTNFDLNPNFSPTNFTLANRTNALAIPTSIAFNPGGSNFYVAAFGSDRIALVDANSGTILSRIELCPTATGSASDPRNKRGTRALALNPGVALYALNRIANTISIIDPNLNALLKEIPVGSFDPTPATIRQGRGFLYDAKLSGNGTVACASCHVDAEMDLLAWDLGDPTGSLITNTTTFPTPLGNLTSNSVYHPMKGPMTTQTLRGLNGLDPFHWRGERTNFTFFNGAFASLMGGTPLSTNDINAYLDFINTIVFEPNPNQNLDRTLPTTFAEANPSAGRNAFINTNYNAGLQCNSCHALPNGTARFILPGSVLQESQDFKVPHLRNIYQKIGMNRGTNAPSIGGFGFLHDGSFQDIFTFLSQPIFGVFSSNSITKSNIQAFLLCFDTGTAPAIGYTRTITSSNVSSASISNDWSLLESQAALITNIDLIVKGTIGGVRHGFVYQPASNNYEPDTKNMVAFTRAQLLIKIQSGDVLTIMGVPPGSGQRMGIDRNLNGVLDADEPPPSLQIAGSGTNLLISWPYGAVGFMLESTTDLKTSWNTVTNPVEVENGYDYMTNNPQGNVRFFRLHLH
ncbi:MAG TPA: beta-propeller fold lactonase family protein [Verrucomicrobiae bacterium]|nr:beta-propeller fold lactonase family protein [Verrucomicrobiae bacterium]